MKRSLFAGCAVLLLAATPAARAHHSPVVFDLASEITLEGVVTGFRWTNPHAWIELSVTGDGGAAEPWAIEMNGPAHLVRAGWTRSTLTVGDRVTIVANPLRTDEPVGKFVSVVLPDGRELDERTRE